MIDGRWHSIILDVRSFREVDCDTEYCLVVGKVRGKLALSTQAEQTFHEERFNHKILSELEVRKQYQIKISNTSAALENLNDREDVNRTSENVKENIENSDKGSLGLYELRQHKSWFDEEF